MSLSSLQQFQQEIENAKSINADAVAGAEARNATLTKPAGALGLLEELAIWYAGWRGDARPSLDAPQVIVFAGNHGVAARGVSAFPPEVTEQMVMNFEHGGAAVNQLAKTFGAKMDVHALSLDRPTQDFTQAPAMSEAELLEALNTGWNAVDTAADLLVVGEMGIGNTTPAAAIAARFYGGGADRWVGRGTGVDDAGLAIKSETVALGLDRHASTAPLDVLANLGGREIAAMTGAMGRARVLGLPMLIDGFIATAAASVLHQIAEHGLDHAVAAHCSVEGAHQEMLRELGKEPILTLGLRLGEGSGAALAIGILKGAIACHSGMASFAEAGVSDG